MGRMKIRLQHVLKELAKSAAKCTSSPFFRADGQMRALVAVGEAVAACSVFVGSTAIAPRVGHE